MNIKKSTWYLVIPILGFILSYNVVTSDQGTRVSHQGETIGLKEGDEFIKDRSTVEYKLTEDESISRINWKYGLSLNEKSILSFNKHLNLDKESLKKPFSKGTELKLFIQSKLGKKFLIDQ